MNTSDCSRVWMESRLWTLWTDGDWQGRLSSPGFTQCVYFPRHTHHTIIQKNLQHVHYSTQECSLPWRPLCVTVLHKVSHTILGCERSDQGKINPLQRQLRKDNYMDRSVIKEPLFKSEFLKSIRQVLRILQMSGLDSLPCHKPSGGTPRVGKETGYRKRRVDGVGVRVSWRRCNRRVLRA